jgi:hypothetical protein
VCGGPFTRGQTSAVQHQPLREYCCYVISFTAGITTVTYSGTFVPMPGMTRQDVFLKVCEDHRQMVPGSRMKLGEPGVCFFSLEPNELM